MAAHDGHLFDTALWCEPAVLETFRTGLLARRKERPDAPGILRSLGQVCRALGALGDARTCYERLVALEPDDRAARHAVAVLRGRPEPRLFDRHAAMMPPFLRITDFLPEAAVDRLLGEVAAMAGVFQSSGVGDARTRRIDPAARRSVTAMANDRVQALVAEPVRAAIGTLDVARRLGVEVGPGAPATVQVHCHRGGDHFEAHRDGTDLHFPLRELTFVYYVHRRPCRFSGGDLCVYDAGLDDAVQGSALAFTRIEPAHNSLILFPSRALHAVAPVTCDSDDLLDGRLAVTGWMLRNG